MQTQVEAFVYLWNKGVESDIQIMPSNGRLKLKFGVLKEEID